MKHSEVKEGRLPVFKERFGELRNGRSNTEFADYLGMSRQTVGFYLNGDRIPDALVLKDIAEKCGVSADWLLGLSNIKELNGDISQVCNYVGLNKDAVVALKDVCSYKSDKTIVDFILTRDSFLCNFVNYIASSAWENVEKKVLGYRPPSKEEIQKYKEEYEQYKSTIRIVSPPQSHPIFTPYAELNEHLYFAQAIKDMTRIHDEFKERYATCDDFIEQLIDDYVRLETEMD